jgi:hypothetical protein
MVGNSLRVVTERDAAAVCAIYDPYVLETVISFEQSPATEAEMARRIRDTTASYPWPSRCGVRLSRRQITSARCGPADQGCGLHQLGKRGVLSTELADLAQCLSE